MQTMQLFNVADMVVPLENRIAKAHAAITTLFRKQQFVVVQFSGGKDSSVVASLVLNAAADYVAQGGKVSILVTTSDTRIESPEIVELFTAELSKMSAFGRRHGFDVQTHVVRPNLLSTWQLKVLTGRGLPSFAGTNSDCSVDLKITPARAFRSRLLSALSEANRQAVTLLGTRYDESTKRALRMALRGEREDIPVLNKDGEYVLSPVAYWSTEDVFEYLGNASSGLIEAYSDFKDTLRIYAHAAGTSCAVVAEAIYEGAARKKGGCGNRTGCFLCQQAEDKSLEAMVEYSEDYAYAKPLLKLNKYIRATRYDWRRRHWIGRTIKAGYIAIEPDSYHPAFIRELTRYMLQMDYDEQRRAERRGKRPKFEILPVEMIVALDAHQSLNGVSLPFQIWADYTAIRSGRVRYDIPEIEPVRETPAPPAKFLFVGEDWDSEGPATGMTGLRDAYIEGLLGDSNCKPEFERLKDGKGKNIWKVETEQSFSVDEESANMILDFELPNLVETYERGLTPGGITYGYKWYLLYGCLQLSHSQRAKHDEVLMRTAYKDRIGLTVNYSIDDIYAKAVPFSALPLPARQAWGKKATTETAQVEMDLESLLT